MLNTKPKVLFITGNIFFSEPHGVLALSGQCRSKGCQTRLAAITRHPLPKILEDYDPDFIAYSAMSPEKDLFKEADTVVRSWASTRGKQIPRVMGGPLPTYFPEILEEFKLDGICVGEGDNALTSMIERSCQGQDFRGIRNVLSVGEVIDDLDKELINDLDSLPFPDRVIYDRAVPLFRMLGMPAIMTSRGCPYNCTYCHNHSYHALFKGLGKFVRRKSVDYVIEELKMIQMSHGPVQMIRFSDDTFAHTIDDWLLDFLPRYKKEIGLPFYCLMRSNTLSDEMGRLLASHGCISIGMAVESGDERIRNELLKRNLSNKLVLESFKVARKYGLKTYGNTMLALPRTTIENDLQSFRFARNAGLSVPTFGVFSPYPRTELTDLAIQSGLLDPEHDYCKSYTTQSPLANYTQKEKDMQVNISYLGTIFCKLPDCLYSLFLILIKAKPNVIFKTIGALHMAFVMAKDIFPIFLNRNIFLQIRILSETVRFLIPSK